MALFVVKRRLHRETKCQRIEGIKLMDDPRLYVPARRIRLGR